MPSLYIVGYGERNMPAFVSMLQCEINEFVKQNDAHVYNSDTLWKAEACPALLKKGTMLKLSTQTDANRRYIGALKVDDWDALYSKYFASKGSSSPDFLLQTIDGAEPTALASLVQSIGGPDALDPAHLSKEKLTELIEGICSLGYPAQAAEQPAIPFTLSNLAELLQAHKQETEWVPEPISGISEDDFTITYLYEKKLDDTNDVCILGWTIEKPPVGFDTFDLFRRLITKLDASFPDIFRSAYITNHDGRDDLSAPQFEHEMLDTKIIHTGRAFYVSDSIKEHNQIHTMDGAPLYSNHPLSNGTFFVRQDPSVASDQDVGFIEKILIPHYTCIAWQGFISRKYFYLNCFDTLTVCDDDPTFLIPNSDPSPSLIFSRGYTPEQIKDIADIHAHPCLRCQGSIKDFFPPD